jgi:pimeloyl-ACP methyl ester carboxylesterase
MMLIVRMDSGQGGVTIVLVHGGRQGGWSWQRVATRLRASGCEVLTPTLTGIGERAHLLRPDIDLDAHVQDLLAVLEYEDVRKAVLVGHSYGGMVITAACELVPAGRVAGLVYFDALLPRAGESAYDLMNPTITADLRAAVTEHGDGWRVPARTGRGVFGLTDPDDVAWAGARLTDQPARTYEQPLRSDAAASTYPRAFIRCTAPPVIPDAVVDRARLDPTWQYAEIAGPHAAMISDPDAVADALLTAAAAMAEGSRPTPTPPGS